MAVATQEEDEAPSLTNVAEACVVAVWQQHCPSRNCFRARSTMSRTFDWSPSPTPDGPRPDSYRDYDRKQPLLAATLKLLAEHGP